MGVGGKCVTKGHIDVIKDMYNGVVTTIRSPIGEISKFSITVGLNLALSFVICLP